MFGWRSNIQPEYATLIRLSLESYLMWCLSSQRPYSCHCMSPVCRKLEVGLPFRLSLSGKSKIGVDATMDQPFTDVDVRVPSESYSPTYTWLLQISSTKKQENERIQRDWASIMRRSQALTDYSIRALTTLMRESTRWIANRSIRLFSAQLW